MSWHCLISSNLNRLHFNFNWLFVLCLWENRRTMNYIHIHIACLLELICIPSFHHIDDFMDAKSISLVSKYVQWCCGGLCSIYTFYSDLGFLSNCWILKFWFLSSTRHNTQDLYGVCPWCFFFFFSMLYVLMIKLLRVGWLGHEILGSF